MASNVFDSIAAPRVTVDILTDGYRASVEISGLAPTRAVSGGESLAGIESLLPPTVVAEDIKSLLSLANRAVLASVEASGTAITPRMIAIVAYSLGYSIRQCLLQQGIDA